MENAKLKPEVRFSEFTKDWKESKFENHFEFKNTNSLSRDKLNYENGEVMNIHYGDIHTNFNTHFDIKNEDLPFINQDVDISRISEENYVQNGDLVMADASEDYADIGKTIEVTNTSNKKILAGLHTFLARKIDNTLADGFFGHLLTNYNVRLELMRIAQGTKVLGLSKGRVDKVPLFIPERDEQQKIADFLTAIDKRISLLKEKKDHLIDYKKGVMQKIFKQEIRFKDDEGNDFPDWKENSFKTLTKINQGLQIAISERYTEPIENSYFYITNEFLKGNSTNYYILNPPDSVKCSKEDVLMTRTGNTGQVVTGVEGAFHNNFFKINFDRDKISKDFLVYFLRLYTTQCSILRLAGTSTIPDLNHSDFYKLKITYPIIDEQNRIVQFLIDLDTKIDGLQSKVDELVDYKKGLLQKMFV